MRSVDVVMRYKNEMKWLPRVLESISNQSITPKKIIFVDDYSTDGSELFAEKSRGFLYYSSSVLHCT